jgi:hypothetical protein
MAIKQFQALAETDVDGILGKKSFSKLLKFKACDVLSAHVEIVIS